jgi:hypothetical protein
MIRHAVTLSELRFFDADEPAPMAPFDACCLVMWESERVVWLRMMHGRMSRKLIRQLVAWMADHGVELVCAHRAQGHVLPLARQREDGHGLEVRVADLVAYFGRFRGPAS